MLIGDGIKGILLCIMGNILPCGGSFMAYCWFLLGVVLFVLFFKIL